MENQTEQKTVLNCLAYHWGEADRAVIHFPESQRLKENRTRSSGTIESMGRLAFLPLEILHSILRELDFESLGIVRSLNSRSREVVGKLPTYRDLTTHAHDALRALSSTGLFSKYSAKHLYDVLCHDRCIVCNEYGPFLFLPTGCRCCFFCINTSPDMSILSASTAANLFALGDQAISQIALKTVCGRYGISQTNHRRQIQILSQQEARKLGILVHGSKKAMEKAVKQRFPNRIRSRPGSRAKIYNMCFMACTPFPYLDVQRGRVENGLCCRGCEYNWYMRNVNFPAPSNDTTDLCEKQDRAFSEDEFLAHFESCASAKMLWNDYILKGKQLSESVEDTLFRT